MGDTGTDDATQLHWGEIDGVSIDFPVVVSDMRQATFTYSVPLDAAAALLPGDSFEVVETSPGEALFVMALVDYVENPWGDYNEVNLGVFAHPVGQPDRAGAFVYRMPVDQEFTMKAGNRVLGLPKTVEDLTFDYTDEQVVVRLASGGVAALTVTLPRAAATGDPIPTEAVTWSYLDGRATELPLTIDLGTGLIDPGEVTVELGEGAIADELRSLGLPGTPDMIAWGEGLTGSFQPPRPV